MKRPTGRLSWIFLFLLASLVAVPENLLALQDATPDREALSVAAQMVRRGATAGDVATEVTRSYRQTPPQTAVILREVGFRAGDAAAALVSHLRLDPDQAAPALRQARYDASAVAAALRGTRLASDRVVVALRAARYSPAEIVGAQRAGLRLDPATAWSDLRRSGVLEAGAEDLLREFLRLNIENPSESRESHTTLVTVVRDLQGAGNATLAQVSEFYYGAGASLAETLAWFREANGWTPEEALRWLLDETTVAEALDLLQNEYGLDATEMVAAILAATTTAQDNALDHLVRAEALRTLLLTRGSGAADAIIHHIGPDDVSALELSLDLLEAFGSRASAVEAALHAALWSSTEDVVAWLRDAGETIAAIAQALKDAGVSGADAAQALLDAGVPSDQVWAALVSGMGLSAQALVEVMDAMGASYDQIAAQLVEQFAMSFTEALGLVTQILGG